MGKHVAVLQMRALFKQPYCCHRKCHLLLTITVTNPRGPTPPDLLSSRWSQYKARVPRAPFQYKDGIILFYQYMGNSNVKGKTASRTSFL